MLKSGLKLTTLHSLGFIFETTMNLEVYFNNFPTIYYKPKFDFEMKTYELQKVCLCGKPAHDAGSSECRNFQNPNVGAWIVIYKQSLRRRSNLWQT